MRKKQGLNSLTHMREVINQTGWVCNIGPKIQIDVVRVREFDNEDINKEPDWTPCKKGRDFVRVFGVDENQNVYFLDLWKDAYKAYGFSFEAGKTYKIYSFYNARENKSSYECTIFGHDSNRELRRVFAITTEDKVTIFSKQQSLPKYVANILKWYDFLKKGLS